MKHWLVFEVFASYIVYSVNGYTLVREYSGQNFFDLWDFYGAYDNTTQGEDRIRYSLYPATVENIMQVMSYGSTSPMQQVRGWRT
jgi:hypothetical protein